MRVAAADAVADEDRKTDRAAMAGVCRSSCLIDKHALPFHRHHPSPSAVRKGNASPTLLQMTD